MRDSADNMTEQSHSIRRYCAIWIFGVGCTMLINVGYDISVEVAAPTPVHIIADVHGSRSADIVSEIPLAVPGPLVTSTDIFSNRVRRFVAPAGITQLSYRATVRDSGLVERQPFDAEEVPVQHLPDECLNFLTGSRYCETDELSALAWQLFGNTKPGWTRVQAICNFVHNHIRFDYQNARATRTALGAYNEATGVCRDFAHLAVTFCRCLNIPARYVNGYLGDIAIPPSPDPMDFAAWFEAYIGNEWVTFDPRNNTPRVGRIVIARGRDAADVPMITSFGLHFLAGFKVVAEEVSAQDQLPKTPAPDALRAA